jgi:predicted transcriptional regulator
LANPDKDRRLQAIAVELKDLNEVVSNLLDQTEKLKAGPSADRIHARLQEKEARIEVLRQEKDSLSEDLSVSHGETVNAQELYEFAKKWDKNFALLTAPERKQFVRTYLGVL